MVMIAVWGSIGILTLMMVGLLWLWIGFFRRVANKPAMLAKDSLVIDSASGPTEYAARGHGFPVLVSHGGAGGYDQGLIIARQFLGEGLFAVAPSRFGHLRTPLAPDSSAAAQADAYVHLLDALDIHRVAVLASSGGGPSALQLALRHPDRVAALVMSAAVSGYLPARSKAVYSTDFGYYLVTTLLRKTSLRAIGVTGQILANLTETERATLEQLLESTHPIRLRRDGLFHDIDEWSDHTRWAQDYPLERISAPTLVIHAADDTVVPIAHAQHSANSIPGARLVTLPNGGHMRFGHIEAIRDMITDFILEHAQLKVPADMV